MKDLNILGKTVSRKQQKTFLMVLCALGGATYFTTFSQLNFPMVVRGYLMIIPLQILALMYVLYVKTVASYSSSK